MEFSKIFRELRLEKNLTQSEIAAKLNMTQTTISSWEKGKREPTMDGLLNIAALYDVSTDYLLGRTDDILALDPYQPPRFSPAQQELIRDISTLDDADATYIRGIIHGYKAARKNKR